MNLSVKSLFFLLVLTLAGFGNGAVRAADFKLTSKGNTITVESSNKTYLLQWCTDVMVRIQLVSSTSHNPNDTLMVNHPEWGNVPFTMVKRDSGAEVRSKNLVVKIGVNPVSFAFYTPKGELIQQDDRSINPMTIEGESPVVNKRISAGEHFFGFGERMDFMDQLGKKVNLEVGRGTARPHELGAYNILEANYCPIPFFMSTRGYGLFFYNSTPTSWDMGNSSPERFTMTAQGGTLDYYFIYGPQFSKIVEQYTGLTGRSPLLPRAAMGLHVGTYSGGTWGFEQLTSQYYVVALAKKFRELGIPVDILHLDSTWRIFGKINGKGGTSFEWRQPGFPDPKAMFDSLYALNFQLVGLHIRPRIDNGNLKNYLSIAREKGLTYPENGKPGDFPNFFDPKAVDWWWVNCLKPLADMGCKFVKTDEGSAFGRVGNELVEKTGPQGKEISSLHNLFPLAYAKAPYFKFQEQNKMRGMEHTREGYAGIQRFPFIFAGDWPSEWQYFKPVIRAGLNIGLSGVPAWSHCMGGFEHVADPELYIRWCQFGMFSPIAHLFGMEHPNYKEPWQYGDEAQAIFKQYDQLRYRLIPYLYTSYFKAYKTGCPIIQAMVFNYPQDPNTYNIDDQYFFGDQLMICPVVEKGAKSRIVYLPAGEWIDFWTGEQFKGRQHVNVATPLNKMPIFVKAGAILPMQPDMEYFGQKKFDPITLDIYPSDSSKGEWYDDDGRSLDYQKGIYSLTQVECSSNAKGVSVKIGTSKGGLRVEDRQLKVMVLISKKPAQLLVNGKTIAEQPDGWVYDEKSHKVVVGFVQKANEEANLSIVL